MKTVYVKNPCKLLMVGKPALKGGQNTDMWTRPDVFDVLAHCGRSYRKLRKLTHDSCGCGQGPRGHTHGRATRTAGGRLPERRASGVCIDAYFIFQDSFHTGRARLVVREALIGHHPGTCLLY